MDLGRAFAAIHGHQEGRLRLRQAVEEPRGRIVLGGDAAQRPPPPAAHVPLGALAPAFDAEGASVGARIAIDAGTRELTQATTSSSAAAHPRSHGHQPPPMKAAPERSGSSRVTATFPGRVRLTFLGKSTVHAAPRFERHLWHPTAPAPPARPAPPRPSNRRPDGKRPEPLPGTTTLGAPPPRPRPPACQRGAGEKAVKQHEAGAGGKQGGEAAKEPRRQGATLRLRPRPRRLSVLP